MTNLELPASTESVSVARRFTRTELEHSSCDVDTVVLLVSEVVTNAVLHARTPMIISVHDGGDVARVEVSDASPMQPRVHGFAVDSATGRGLRLLDRLSLRWGTDQRMAGPGKVVWFEVGTPAESAWDSFAEGLALEGL